MTREGLSSAGRDPPIPGPHGQAPVSRATEGEELSAEALCYLSKVHKVTVSSEWSWGSQLPEGDWEAHDQ